MNHDGQTFIEAVETLSAQAGVDMPKADPDAARKAERAKGLKEGNDHLPLVGRPGCAY